MARTLFRQESQIRPSFAYVDNVAPSATMESGAASIEDDLNNLRSIASLLRDVQTGNWYDDLAVPPTFVGEGGARRGVQNLNNDLHNIERKRALRYVQRLVDVTVASNANFKVLALGELPTNTTAAVGVVATRGTVAAAHGGVFGTHSLAEVAGASAIRPKNLIEIVDGSTRDPLLSDGRTIHALFQTESATDGHTMTGSGPTRAQISFVRINASGDDLEAVPVADIENRVINFASHERLAFKDLDDQDFLKGAGLELSAGGGGGGGGLDPIAHRLLDTLTHSLDETHEQVPAFNADGVMTIVSAQGLGGGTLIRVADAMTADADGLITGARVQQYDSGGSVVETLTAVVTITAGVPTKNTVTRT